MFSIQNGDPALLRCQWELHGARPDGKPVAMNGKNAEIAPRQPSGDWLFVIDHPFGAS